MHELCRFLVLAVALCLLSCRAENSAIQSNAPSLRETATSVAVAELTWAEQIDLIRSGKSQKIHVTRPISSQDLQLLTPDLDLTELLIDEGSLGDRDLLAITQLSKLEHLRVRESLITDSGVQLLSVEKLPELRVLNLPQAEISAEAMRHLAKLPNLTQLRIGGAKFDDLAAAELASFTQLRGVHLIGPQLTDASLASFAKMPKLSSLYIDDCHLSDDAWHELFKAKPILHVHIDQGHHDRDPGHHEH